MVLVVEETGQKGRDRVKPQPSLHRTQCRGDSQGPQVWSCRVLAGVNSGNGSAPASALHVRSSFLALIEHIYNIEVMERSITAQHDLGLAQSLAAVTSLQRREAGASPGKSWGVGKVEKETG